MGFIVSRNGYIKPNGGFVWRSDGKLIVQFQRGTGYRSEPRMN
jgi:hypothetical protein